MNKNTSYGGQGNGRLWRQAAKADRAIGYAKHGIADVVLPDRCALGAEVEAGKVGERQGHLIGSGGDNHISVGEKDIDTTREVVFYNLVGGSCHYHGAVGVLGTSSVKYSALKAEAEQSSKFWFHFDLYFDNVFFCAHKVKYYFA